MENEDFTKINAFFKTPVLYLRTGPIWTVPLAMVRLLLKNGKIIVSLQIKMERSSQKTYRLCSRKCYPCMLGHDYTIHGDVRYACDLCYYKATQKGHLKRHTDCVHGGVRHCCDQCDYETNWKGTIKRHIDSVHADVRYSCDQCDYRATRKDTLKTHKDFAHGDYKSKWKVCLQTRIDSDYKATQKGHLKQHKYSVHGNVRSRPESRHSKWNSQTLTDAPLPYGWKMCFEQTEEGGKVVMVAAYMDPEGKVFTRGKNGFSKEILDIFRHCYEYNLFKK